MSALNDEIIELAKASPHTPPDLYAAREELHVLNRNLLGPVVSPLRFKPDEFKLPVAELQLNT